MKIVIDTNVLISKDYNGENVTEEFENCDRYNVLISGVFFGAFPKKIVSAVCQKIPACATIKNILIPHAFYNFSTEKILKPNQRNTLLLQAFR